MLLAYTHFLPECRVEAVQQTLADLTGIYLGDQILMCDGARLDAAKPLSAYGLPAVSWTWGGAQLKARHQCLKGRFLAAIAPLTAACLSSKKLGSAACCLACCL